MTGNTTHREVTKYLLTLLATISPANGYNSTIFGISERDLSEEQLVSHPQLALITGPQTEHPVTEDDREVYEARAAYAVIGYVSAETSSATESPLVDAADLLAADIKRVFLKKENQENLFRNTTSVSLELTNDEPFYDYQKNTGEVTVYLVVTYYFDEDV